MENMYHKIEEICERILSDPLMTLISFTIILFLSREIICWFLRINDRLYKQNDIISKLNEIIDLQKTQIRLLENNISNISETPEEKTTKEAPETNQNTEDS